MVIALIIAALVVAGIWLQMRYYKDLAETYIELYEDERSSRIDFQVELSYMQAQLNDSRAAVSRLIARNSQLWAGSEAQKVH